MSNIVYHYTSPEGIYGILKHKTLRFTDCQYLNDISEFTYIRKPLKEAWKQIVEKYNQVFIEEEIDRLIEKILISPFQIDEPNYELVTQEAKESGYTKEFGDLVNKYNNTFRYYVLCASKNNDSSSMWNYYVKNGVYRGYNLGIDIFALEVTLNNISQNGVKFLKGEVIYKFEEQVSIIREKIEKIINKNNPKQEDADISLINSLRTSSDFWNFIHEQKIFFKNPAFENEEEYRFILSVNNKFEKEENDDERTLAIEYRVGASGIITPYIELKFKLIDKSHIFKRITLAPMIESEIAKKGFERFLADEVKENITIEESSIKLRF